MPASRHLDQIITHHHHVTTLQVVFVDVEKYSKRRTQTQAQVIEKFTESLNEALTEVSKDYIKYSQDNDLNLREDTIVIPTGDGAAIGFSFDGIHDIHLWLGLKLLRLSNGLRRC